MILKGKAQAIGLTALRNQQSGMHGLARSPLPYEGAPFEKTFEQPEHLLYAELHIRAILQAQD